MTIRYKFVFVGDLSVGKTSILNRFTKNIFAEEYESTIGVDFETKIIKYKDSDPIKLQLWDSAGQERYRSLIPSYVKNANAIFIVYDVSEKQTFLHVDTWLEFVKKHCDQNTLLVLCGNKIDMEKRDVTKEEAESLASKRNMLFFEVSAKNNTNILEMFFTSVTKLPVFEKVPEEAKAEIIQDLIKENGNDYDPSPRPPATITVRPSEGEKPKPKKEENDEEKHKACC